MHNRVAIRARVNKNDKICKSCNKGDETTMHIYARCDHAREIWETYEYIYKLILPQIKFNYEYTVLTLNIQRLSMKNNKHKLILTLTELIIYELWMARNKKDKEGIERNKERSIKTINKNFSIIINTHYKHHKRTNTMENFKEEVLPSGSNKDAQARLDVAARGFWQRGEMAFFNIRVFSTPSPKLT